MATITMYTTEYCPYCVRAKSILKAKGVTEINEVRIDSAPEQRQIMMERTSRRTVPQIYINDFHVGGCDDLEALNAAGKLDPLLQQA